MTAQVAHRNDSAIRRWWAVPVAILLTVANLWLALVFAVVTAIVFRRDKPVAYTLGAIALLVIVALTLFTGVSGGGIGTSG
ncbi:hypothetical protein KMZ32_01895 [Phycicoccus sp. MAQZ13P-2]|uniref:hypothetical protein n=1 Tax=Phycicoccus mangrovi TaxID=2840470 RepID=UPI001C005B21|nr:hypothetical protein [Phycicoccus mangrovi]MBT9254445.1 hypothetical protein [Phycicoccus mangrovi]MBT9272823.1 hypothetical protein [Phycicoccus mangrovi]